MRVHIVLPDDLLKEIDSLVGKRERSRFVAEAVRERVRREKLLATLREGAGILSDEKYPYWSTPDKVVEWVRELRDTPSIRDKDGGKLPPRHKRAG